MKVRKEIVNRLGLMADLPMPETFYLVEQTAQVQYLHTIIRFEKFSLQWNMNMFWSFRNKQTVRDEFIFYSKRLMRVLIEYALSLLPFEVRYLQLKIL